MTEQEVAREMARQFSELWLSLVLAHAPEKAKPGRPRLVIPEQYREHYPRWRRYYGAKTAREMVGLAA